MCDLSQNWQLVHIFIQDVMHNHMWNWGKVWHYLPNYTTGIATYFWLG